MSSKNDILKPGDDHYRAYVGPPEDYDLVSAMVFNLLTHLGLRENHRVLDIGCGSLRNGRLLIPYLNKRNYIGVEPNKWLVEDAIANETGRDLIKLKKPKFSYQSSMCDFPRPLNIDFAVAQSIFSHCGKNLIEQWLEQIAFHLEETGALLATFLSGKNDFDGQGWIYPGCVQYKPNTLKKISTNYGLHFETINWAHPRQQWAIFAKKNHDLSLLKHRSILWNRYVESLHST